MAKAVDDLAKITPGKKSIAIEGYARALRQIPSIIADNGGELQVIECGLSLAGYDSSELIGQLRAAHYEGKVTAGLDMTKGAIGDAKELGITESLKVKRQVVLSASEAAEMILRIDEVIKAPPRKREHDPRY